MSLTRLSLHLTYGSASAPQVEIAERKNCVSVSEKMVLSMIQKIR